MTTNKYRMPDKTFLDMTYTQELASHLLAASETSSPHYESLPAAFEDSYLREENKCQIITSFKNILSSISA